MTDKPHCDPAAPSVSQAIPTAAEAFGRLDMPLLAAMMTQRAVRRVLPDPVDDVIVLKCIELGLRAPTGSNGQNWEFVAVKDRRIKEKLAKRYRQAWSVALATQYRPWTTGRGLGRHLATNDEPMTKLLRAVQWQVDHLPRSPSSSCPAWAAGLVPYMPSPHVLASGGLGAGLVTLPLWSVTSARKILGLPPSVTPYWPTASPHSAGRRAATGRRRASRSSRSHLDGYGNRAWLDS